MVKMHAKNQWNDVARKNLNSLCDVEAIIGLPYIFSLLKCVHALIKVAQGRNVFVCDFKESTKVAHQEFCMFYCDSYVKFEDLTFDDFNFIEALTNFNLPMEWFFDLNAWHSELLGIFLCWPHVSYILQWWWWCWWFSTCHQTCIQLGIQQGEKGMWRCNSRLGVGVVKTIPKAWIDDYSRCFLLIVLGYK